MLIQSGPEDDEADALLTIASQAGVPKHMNLGLVQMKDQERMDRCPALPCPALPCPALPCPALPCVLHLCTAATDCQQMSMLVEAHPASRLLLVRGGGAGISGSIATLIRSGNVQTAAAAEQLSMLTYHTSRACLNVRV